MLSFREVVLDDAVTILRWRTSNRVTKFMNTDVVYDLEAQRKWLSSSYGKAHYYHWIILSDERPIGLINLADFAEREKTTSWGFYVGEEDLKGYGAFIPPYFYKFLFEKLKIERINAEVFYNNTNVIGLHLLHGYKFAPINDRVIKKNDKDILLIGMSLDKQDWNSSRFSRNKSDFPVEHWTARPSVLMGR